MDKMTDRLWDEYEEGFLELLRIPSVYDEKTASKEMPFGKYSHDALLYMKNVLENEGFSVTMYDDAVISAEYGDGPDDERIDIVSHLDVVEPGEGWAYPPFAAVKKDGRIIARGSQDMKSGAWLTFLALKHLKDTGYVPKRKLRLVYGSDEERTMDDMKTYVRHAGLPSFAFTPDSQFPLITGEKGALMWVMEGDMPSSLISMDAGIQCNVIPPHAEAVIRTDDLKKVKSVISSFSCDAVCETVPEGIRITAGGIPAHASMPESGHSATSDLLRIISEVTEDPLIRRLYCFFSDPYGKNGGMYRDIPPMGRLTLNPGIMKVSNGMLFSQIDCRYPYGVSSEELTEVFRKAFPELVITLPYDDPPTLVDGSSPFVAALKTAYEKITGKKCRENISGGVSYSKVFGNCVNFGSVPEDEPFLAHRTDESAGISGLKQSLSIYIEALIRLSEV